MSSKKLTVERIFSSPDFVDEGFDRPRWCSNGNDYTTLRRVAHSVSMFAVSSITSGNSDLTSTTGSASGSINMDLHEIVLHDACSGVESTLVSCEQLTPWGETSPLSVDDYTVSDDRSKVLIFTKSLKVWRLKTKGCYWVLDLTCSNRSPESLKQLGKGLDSSAPNEAATELKFATFSPDLRHVAYVFKNNIYVEDYESNIIQITDDGNDVIINGTFDWVYEEEFGLYDGFRWSPDSRRIAYWQIDQSGVGTVNLVNNTDSLYPKLNPIRYPKCGDTNPSARIGVVDIPSRNDRTTPVTKWIEFDDNDSRNHYIADMCYIESKKDENGEIKQQIVVQRLNRLQNQLSIYTILLTEVGFDISILYKEQSPEWIDIAKPLRWLSIPTSLGMGKNNFFLLNTERNGWSQLCLIPNSDVSSVEGMMEVTPCGFDVETVCGYDENLMTIYFIASPADPLRRFLFSVSLTMLKEKEPLPVPLAFPVQRVTPLDDGYLGTNGYTLSTDGKYAVHTLSSAEVPVTTAIVSLPSHELKRFLSSNQRLCDAYKKLAAPSAEESEFVFSPIEFFSVPISPELKLDGWCIYPPKFDSSLLRAYPVIFYVYGEPAACTVRDRWAGKIGIWHRLLAQRGAVVISVDNRGTPSLRGAAWRKHIYKAIGSNPSVDQAMALSSIMKARPYLDPERVGIWGWSGGGSMSLNMLFRYPQLYKTAVAVAPVPDMRLYDTIYQERYMATPQCNPQGYFDGSPINFAKYMTEKQNLFVIHGTGDDNCHYQGVECLINELIRLNKQFRMFAYPNRTHSISEGMNTTHHLFSMITDYFKEKNLIN